MENLDLNHIREYYAGFDSDKLERIALTEVGRIDSKVVPILEDEIKKRNLSPNLNLAIKVQLEELNTETKDRWLNMLQNEPCSYCKSRSSNLQGGWRRTVRSFIIFTSWKKTPIIACRECLYLIQKNAINSSLLLGWWGIPNGLIKTPLAIFNTLKDRRNSEKVSLDVLAEFIEDNIGYLAFYEAEHANFKDLLQSFKEFGTLANVE